MHSVFSPPPGLHHPTVTGTEDRNKSSAVNMSNSDILHKINSILGDTLDMNLHQPSTVQNIGVGQEFHRALPALSGSPDLYLPSFYGNQMSTLGGSLGVPFSGQHPYFNLPVSTSAPSFAPVFKTSAAHQEFIPGAICNRTLECLSDQNPDQPSKFRAIKAADRRASYSSDYASPSSTGSSFCFDRTSSPIPPSSTGRYITRSPLPDSDTSGISSDSSSETALLEIMSNLNFGTPATQTIPTVEEMANIFRTNLLTSLEPIKEETPSEVFRGDKTWMGANSNSVNALYTTNSDPNSIERAARNYRTAATYCEATCTWSGRPPPKIYKNPTYSCKVFLGGVPWDITEATLQLAFKAFGPVRIEWPGKDKNGHYPGGMKGSAVHKGYVYVLFDSERAVKSLLQICTHDFNNGGEYYFKISSRRMRSKEVQVIPWVLSDSNFVRQPSQRIDNSKTVFVGALHGMLNAEALAQVMNDLFGNVVYAGVDTDKHKYPIGSGRVTFSSQKSYMKAISAAFVEIKTQKFVKKVQVDPYLEESLCKTCNIQQGPYFCRDPSCFKYFCRSCWQWQHSLDALRHHKPLMRNSKTGTSSTLHPSAMFHNSFN